MAMNVKFLRGLVANYEGLATKDPDTLYFCTDGALYLGSNKIANWTDLTSVNAAIEALQNAGYQNASQVQTAVNEALENYYTKDEIDSKIGDLDVGAMEGRIDALETGIANVYTKDEADELHTEADTALKKYADDAVAVEKARAEAAEAANAAAIAVEKGRLDTFLMSADLTENAVDTLKEIQDYINSDGAAAEEMLSKIATAQSTAEQGVADAATALAAAQAAQSDFDTYEAAHASDYTNEQVDGKISAAIAAENLGQYAKSADIADSLAKAESAVQEADLAPYAKTADIEGSLAKAESALQAADLADYAKTADVNSAIATATTDMATNASVDSKLEAYAKSADVANDIATATADMATNADVATALEPYAKSADVTTEIGEAVADKATKTELSEGLAGKVDNATYEAHLATQSEKDAAQDEAIASKTTLDAVKEAYVGDTNAKLVDVVKAVNMLAEGSDATDKAVETVATNVKDIEAQLTWGEFE